MDSQIVGKKTVLYLGMAILDGDSKHEDKSQIFDFPLSFVTPVGFNSVSFNFNLEWGNMVLLRHVNDTLSLRVWKE